MSSKKSSIDIGLVRELAELLKESDLSEIEIIEDDTSIRLARGGGVAMAMQAQPAYAPAPAMAAPAAAPAVAVDDPATNSGTPVPSPMVGTAYHSPGPDSDPFIKVGQKVKKGQTIMIIEAMKNMNQIASPQDGTVARICVENAQPVEFGETLIELE